MILYTPLPLEQIFQGIEDLKSPVDIAMADITMQVEPVSATEARIVRLISPRAEDYLNPAYAPGRIIRYPV
ncbi:YlzJ-like family protein [Paenibacillus sp.]|uniref:YlzJ-like family protein n=1 Tax=Paenibacillus sp. TaxID=58172 RepID=UPI002D73E62C|nr:YlzJ-like family protein [Paenibacillus sp.]HZG86770.1 YlzJ-like family protein [Paenibacillus sp.]